jgi:hypothetical protein
MRFIVCALISEKRGREREASEARSENKSCFETNRPGAGQLDLTPRNNRVRDLAGRFPFEVVFKRI